VPILPARFPDDLDTIHRLFSRYSTELDIDLEFQDFAAELRSLPGDYAPPRGCLLLAWSDGEPVGVVAMRPLDDDVCEMKRMVIVPEARRQGTGLRLGEAVLTAARDAGYKSMRLDTLARLEPARDLYTSMGFVEIPPYRYNPHDDAVFMELTL
jgi:GNAT superfamily N-acetyltransferase